MKKDAILETTAEQISQANILLKGARKESTAPENEKSAVFERTGTAALKVAPEQIRYANILFYGTWGGLLALSVLFLLYVAGLITPFVPSSQVIASWGMSVHDYNAHLNLPAGWGWLGMLMYGDFLNFLGIAFLALLTIVGYLVLIPYYLKNKDLTYAAIAGLEIMILTLAASGVLRVGH